MFSINCINVFICLIFYLMFVDGNHIASSGREAVISWQSTTDIQRLFANNSLDYVLFPSRRNRHTSHRESRSNRGVENSNAHAPHRSHDHNQHQPSRCGSECKVERDVSKILWEESLKAHILKSLNMTEPPQISDADLLPNVSRAVLDMVEEMNQIDVNTHTHESGVTTGKLVSVAKQYYFDNNTNNDVLFFNLTSERRENSRVRRVVLQFYTNPDNFPDSNVTVTLYRYRNGYRLNLRPIAISSSLVRRNQGWTTITYPALKNLVNGWMSFPETNEGIALVARDHPNLISTEIGFKPYLQIEFEPNNRRKRGSDNIRYCDANTKSDHCCIFQFDINFEAIGWKWVIHPSWYRANYCAGYCTVAQQPSVHTALVKAQQRNMTDLAEWKKAKACCVPKEYEPVNLLYYDHQSNIVYSVVPDMKIVRCGCA